MASVFLFRCRCHILRMPVITADEAAHTAGRMIADLAKEIGFGLRWLPPLDGEELDILQQTWHRNRPVLHRLAVHLRDGTGVQRIKGFVGVVDANEVRHLLRLGAIQMIADTDQRQDTTVIVVGLGDRGDRRLGETALVSGRIPPMIRASHLVVS